MAHEIYLSLGCKGKKDGEFISCPSVENRILHITPHLEKIQDMIVYFKGLGLFQRPLYDFNAVRHVIRNLQEKYYQGIKPLWDDKYYKLLDRFTLVHKDCGLVLSVVKEHTKD